MQRDYGEQFHEGGGGEEEGMEIHPKKDDVDLKDVNVERSNAERFITEHFCVICDASH